MIGKKLKLVGVTCLLLTALAACYPSESQKLVEKCEELVLERLRSPASAIFSEERIEVVNKEVSNIHGAVDSQNGFGALIRSRFQCQKTTSGTYLMSLD